MKAKEYLNLVSIVLFVVVGIIFLFSAIVGNAGIADAIQNHDIVSCTCDVCTKLEPYFYEEHFSIAFSLSLIFVLLLFGCIASFCFDQAYWLDYRDVLERYNLRHPEPELQINIPERNKDLKKLKKHMDEYWQDYRLGFAYRDYLENFQKK